MDIKENIKNAVTEQVKEKGSVLADKAIDKVGAGDQLAGVKEQAVNKAAEAAGDLVDNIAGKFGK